MENFIFRAVIALVTQFNLSLNQLAKQLHTVYIICHFSDPLFDFPSKYSWFKLLEPIAALNYRLPSSLTFIFSVLNVEIVFRSLFRTQSNIYDEAFLRKQVTAFSR